MRDDCNKMSTHLLTGKSVGGVCFFRSTVYTGMDSISYINYASVGDVLVIYSLLLLHQTGQLGNRTKHANRRLIFLVLEGLVEEIASIYRPCLHR